MFVPFTFLLISKNNASLYRIREITFSRKSNIQTLDPLEKSAVVISLSLALLGGLYFIPVIAARALPGFAGWQGRKRKEREVAACSTALFIMSLVSAVSTAASRLSGEDI